MNICLRNGTGVIQLSKFLLHVIFLCVLSLLNFTSFSCKLGFGTYINLFKLVYPMIISITLRI